MSRQFTPDQRKQLLSAFFELDKSQFNKCLAPGMECPLVAIRAHSLPNSSVLDLLARDGHVKTIRKRTDRERGPILLFENVGRNQATTFQGFCSQHDSDIFKPIETGHFDPENVEYLFLLAYRAVARELHALLDGAFKNQLGYQKRVEIGFDPANEPSQAGLLAIDRMMTAYETYVYKCKFDESLLSQNYRRVMHDVIHLDHEEATVAVCSLFSIDEIRQEDCVRVALNLFPLRDTKSVAVFSYLPEDATQVRIWLGSILNSSDFYQKYLLSKAILSHCENFVLSPAYFKKWDSQKKAAVTAYFTRTLLAQGFEVESRDLFLF
jgi:hypothetical protein